MKVLVTGARGLVGRTVLKSLSNTQHEVVAVTRDDVDLESHTKTFEFFSEIKPRAVIHCAAKVGGILANVRGGGNFLTVNSRIDTSVIFAARDLGVEFFSYMGSSCMYPANRSNALREEELLSGPLEVTNESYAVAKIHSTKLVEAIGISTDAPWRTFVASNLYGPHDHFDSENSHLVAAIISKVVSALRLNLPVVEMWGDGSVRREFTYVDDFAEWVVASLLVKELPRILNVGFGRDYSVREYYEKVMESLNYNGKLIADEAKPSGSSRKLLDSSLARSYGWTPKTSLESGISRTANWYLAGERG